MNFIRPLICIVAVILVSNNCIGNAAGLREIKTFKEKDILKIDTLPSDSLRWYLSTINVTPYYNTPVDSFLFSIPNTPMNMFVSSCQMGRNSMYNACYLQVSYYPDIVVRIYVKNFTHMAKYSPTLSWDINLFRLEDIHRISVFKDERCVNGFCKTPN